MDDNFEFRIQQVSFSYYTYQQKDFLFISCQKTSHQPFSFLTFFLRFSFWMFFRTCILINFTETYAYATTSVSTHLEHLHFLCTYTCMAYVL